MPEGPGKSAAWHQLMVGYLLLRRADFYGVKVRHDREKARIAEEAMREKAATGAGLSPEEKEERMDRILGTGRFQANWNNQTKKWEGPGAALRYEEGR